MKIHEFQARPIEQWPGKLTHERKRSPFRAGYGDTMALLASELQHLNARGAVLLMALTPGEIRIDGRPRADARPSHPGVILSFDGPNGPMQFPCDRFDHWADNVRAIALALEALRKVDRYGVTSHGEQYRGWAALPPPANNGFSSKADAWIFLRRIVGDTVETVTADRAIREAEMVTHPDRGGDPDDFKRVQEARRLLVG